MAKLAEHEVFAAVAGERVNDDRLEQLGVSVGAGTGNYEDCIHYLLTQPEQWSDPLVRLFRITPALTSGWLSRDIAFAVQLYIKDGCIAGGRIIKYKETCSECGLRPSGYEMAPTQQELRIAKRIVHSHIWFLRGWLYE